MHGGSRLRFGRYAAPRLPLQRFPALGAQPIQRHPALQHLQVAAFRKVPDQDRLIVLQNHTPMVIETGKLSPFGR